jgi:hypothetical protein
VIAAGCTQAVAQALAAAPRAGAFVVLVTCLGSKPQALAASRSHIGVIIGAMLNRPQKISLGDCEIGGRPCLVPLARRLAPLNAADL